MSPLKVECRCQRCGHVWHSRKESPAYCPACRSAAWDVPKGFKPHPENNYANHAANVKGGKG